MTFTDAPDEPDEPDPRPRFVDVVRGQLRERRAQMRPALSPRQRA